MYPAYTQLVAKWSSPSIGDQRATGCEGVVRWNRPGEIFHEIRFRKIFFRSSTCRHFRSGDQWEADILEERARPLSWERWDRGDHKVGKQGNGIALWLWRLSKSFFISIRKIGSRDVLRLKAGGTRSKPKIIFFQGKSFLHLYLCSVAEGGEPRMVMTDRKNTPLAKRIIMSCVISWTVDRDNGLCFRQSTDSS